jgi:hypothetical protein
MELQTATSIIKHHKTAAIVAGEEDQALVLHISIRNK